MPPTITFLGATETVTGSRYLVEGERARVLVDCGLFQGYKNLREQNWMDLPFDPSSLDAVVLTHAHIDHTGYLPRLCNLGFSGTAFCTQGTRDLLQILLPDSGYLQEEDARRANKYGYTRHHPAKPLYTREDAERCLTQLGPKPYYETFSAAPGVSAKLTRAGHILGSSCLALTIDETTITFTGDVGRPSDPIMKPPDTLGPTDFLVTESTYGDRPHPDEDAYEVIEHVIRETADQGGTIVVPAFAVGRAQHLLHILAELKTAGRIPDIPVFLDSPMSIRATRIFFKHEDEDRLSEAQCDQMAKVAQYTRTPEESKAIDSQNGPSVIISASGMATGGRILHHLRRFLPDKKNTILFAGFQAAGTRGRSLVEGADDLKIHGEYIPVRARVRQIESLSAHADYRELIEWLRTSRISPRRVFVTHGEPNAADAFRRRLKDTFAWDVLVPQMGRRVTLT